MQNKGILYGIGVGPGDPDLLTVKATKVLQSADVIFVPKSKEQASTALSIINDYLLSSTDVVNLEFSMSKDLQNRINSRKKNAAIIEEKLSKGLTVVFLTLGDPMLYSTYSYILEYISTDYKYETIPGIYSFAAISSLLSLPLCKGNDKLAVICSFDEQTKDIFKAAETIVCMKVSAYHKKLYQTLNQNSDFSFVMMTDAGKPEQKTYTSIDVLREEIPYFSTAIIQKIKVDTQKK